MWFCRYCMIKIHVLYKFDCAYQMICTSTCMYNDHDLHYPFNLTEAGCALVKQTSFMTTLATSSYPKFHHGHAIEATLPLVVLLSWGMSLHLSKAGTATWICINFYSWCTDVCLKAIHADKFPPALLVLIWFTAATSVSCVTTCIFNSYVWTTLIMAKHDIIGEEKEHEGRWRHVK